MNAGFTDFLTALEKQAGSPEDETLEALWQALRAALVTELKKRGLWTSPPRYLGVSGAARWWHSPGGGARDALDELVGECYLAVFVERLRSLRSHLEAKGNVDGLVFLAIRNFVHERQSESDPVGYRVFDLTRRAVGNLLARDSLVLVGKVAGTSAPPSNESVLSFSPRPEPPLARREDLGVLVPAWNDDLLPELVTARYQEKRRVQEKLEGRIAALPEEGVRAFRFRDLVEPLKDDARARWRAVAARSQGESAWEETADGRFEVTLRCDPDPRLEEADRFEQLAGGVSRTIEERPDLDSKTREYLRRMWRGLVSSSRGDGPARPSDREMARSLGIPRDRFPKLWGMLQSLVSTHRDPTLPEKRS